MVLSELRRRQRDAGVVAWIAEQRQEDCFLSVVSVGEIERGIARRRAADPVFAGDEWWSCRSLLAKGLAKNVKAPAAPLLTSALLILTCSKLFQ